jgi:hypothetical protein
VSNNTHEQTGVSVGGVRVHMHRFDLHVTTFAKTLTGPWLYVCCRYTVLVVCCRYTVLVVCCRHTVLVVCCRHTVLVVCCRYTVYSIQSSTYEAQKVHECTTSSRVTTI